MLKKALIAVLVLLLAFTGYLFVQAGVSANQLPDYAYAAGATDAKVIAFGSCNRQDHSQAYWEVIASHNPDAWLWLGDNIYSDTDDMEEMKADYAVQNSAPEYVAFKAATPIIYGAWDDHDYGSNDAGKEWAVKDEAKVLMMDFLAVPEDAAVRSRPGTYQSYDIDGIKVILLDTRYFRDEVLPPTQPNHRYGPNPDGDILGEAQWAWLEEELRNSSAKAHIIASSIQVLPTQHGYEKWALFPTARQRLLTLLADVRPALPVLLSGDRHLAEISVDSVGGYPIYEITSSGLTHAYTGADEANDKRLGPLVAERNYGLLYYTGTGDSLNMYAEVRAIDNDEVLLSLSLPKTANNPGLGSIVQPKDPMSVTLKPCPDKPNCVSTQSTQPKKKRDPIAYNGTAEAAIAELKQVVNNMSGTTLVKEEGNYLHFTFKTWPIPFIDDVEFMVDEQEKMIHYRSASRVGHSDLGVNSRRMAKIVAAFEAIN